MFSWNKFKFNIFKMCFYDIHISNFGHLEVDLATFHSKKNKIVWKIWKLCSPGKVFHKAASFCCKNTWNSNFSRILIFQNSKKWKNKKIAKFQMLPKKSIFNIFSTVWKENLQKILELAFESFSAWFKGFCTFVFVFRW